MFWALLVFSSENTSPKPLVETARGLDIPASQHQEIDGNVHVRFTSATESGVYFFTGAATKMVTTLDGNTMRTLPPRGRAGSAARTKSCRLAGPETQKL